MQPLREAALREREGPWGRLWPLLALLLAVVAFYAPALIEGRLVGAGDGIAYYFPVRVIAFESLRHGELPFWNPYNFGGAPLLAAIQPGVFFPGNWAFLALPAGLAMNVTAMLATWTAGAVMFGFSRATGLSRTAGLASALTFMFGAFMVAGICALPILQVAGLVPALLWAVERYRSTVAARYAIAGTLILALMILAGHPQMVAYGLIVAGVYAAWRGLSVATGDRLRYGVGLLAMVALGVGLALMQLLPTLDLIKASQREAFGYWQLAWGAMPARALPTFLFPFLFGVDAVSGLFSTPYWGPSGWMEGLYGYVGLGAVLLAAVAIAHGRRDARALFWAGVAGFALLLAMGSATPVFWLWTRLPVVNMMPGAGRHLMEVTLALAVLAGLGVHAIEGRGDRRAIALGCGAVGGAMAAFLAALAAFGPAFAARTQPLISAGVDLAAALSIVRPAFWGPVVLWGLMTGVLLLGARPGRLWRGALLALIFADMWAFGHHHGWRLYSQYAADFGPVPKVAEAAGRHLGLPKASFPFMRPAAELKALGYPATASLEKRRSVNGYDAFILQRTQQVLRMGSDGFVRPTSGLWSHAHHALDLLGLRTVTLDREVAPPASFADTGRWKRLPDHDGMARYRNARALPRAWRPGAAAVLPLDRIDAMVAADPAFDPRALALLEAPSAAALAPGKADAWAVSLNRIRVETEGAGPGLVVVSESHDPGWRAFAGERELPVHRVDGLILGVEVPAGGQVFELRYEPRLWRAGLAGSAGALALLAAWGFLARRRKWL